MCSFMSAERCWAVVLFKVKLPLYSLASVHFKAVGYCGQTSLEQPKKWEAFIKRRCLTDCFKQLLWKCIGVFDERLSKIFYQMHS